MARYRDIDLSLRLLPVDLDARLVSGSFAHALHHLVDSLDLTAFDAPYRNDLSGAQAHAPARLLKAVLLGYSQGLVSSRAIERACRDNVLFTAIKNRVARTVSGSLPKHARLRTPMKSEPDPVSAPFLPDPDSARFS
jgi:transposase